MSLDSPSLESVTPEPAVALVVTEIVANEPVDTFDELAFVSEQPDEVKAVVNEDGETVEEPAEVEAKAETPETPEAKPAEDSDAIGKARRILAAANKKELKIADTVAKAEAKILDEFKTNPTKIFDRLGMSFKEWLIKASGAETSTETPKADDRVTALEQKIADKELKEQEANVQRLVADVQGQVKADPTYVRINRSGSQSMVTDLMVEYHALHGKPLPLKVAAHQVEQYLKTLSGDPDVVPPKVTAPKKASNSKDTQAASRPGQTTLTNNETRGQPPANSGRDYNDDREDDRRIMAELGLL